MNESRKRESWVELQERLDDPNEPDVVREQVQPDDRRAAQGGGEIIPPELGRVPRSLEGKLSPDERAAYDRNLELFSAGVSG